MSVVPENFMRSGFTVLTILLPNMKVYSHFLFIPAMQHHIVQEWGQNPAS